MHKYEYIEKMLDSELEAMDQKYKSGSKMTVDDLDKLDKIAHAGKSLLCYCKEKKNAEYEDMMPEEGNMSGYRGRAANGRYVSRSGSYADGYSQGYAEGRSQAMRENQSGYNGHIPYMPYDFRY